jgi:hypothetical protein
LRRFTILPPIEVLAVAFINHQFTVNVIRYVLVSINAREAGDRQEITLSVKRGTYWVVLGSNEVCGADGGLPAPEGSLVQVDTGTRVTDNL